MKRIIININNFVCNFSYSVYEDNKELEHYDNIRLPNLSEQVYTKAKEHNISEIDIIGDIDFSSYIKEKIQKLENFNKDSHLKINIIL